MAQASSQSEIHSDLTNLLVRMEQAEKKLEANAKTIDGPVGGVELREYQLQILQKLRLIRDTMKGEDLSIDQLRKERDQARTERDALQKQVSKLEYRIEHLKQHVVVHPTGFTQ